MKFSIVCCFTTICFFIHVHFVHGQNVGINNPTPDPSAMLDIVSSDKGLLIPRVALVATNSNIPIGAGLTTSLLVYNTVNSGSPPNQVIPGYYYWDGALWVRILTDINNSDPWLISGNNGTNPATHFIGTSDAQALVIKTNNIERMRVLNTGQVGINTLTPQTRLHIDGDIAYTEAEITFCSTVINNVLLTTNSFYRMKSCSPSLGVVNITGISGGVNGKLITLFNQTTKDMILVAQSTSSLVQNRFLTSMGNITLSDSGSVTLQYSSNLQRWIVTSMTKATGQGDGRMDYHYVFGTSNITATTSLALMPQMVINFTPNDTIAVVNFAAAGSNSGTTCGQGGINFALLVNNVNVLLFHTTIEDVFNSTAKIWDVNLDYPVRVNPGVNNKVEIFWQMTSCSNLANGPGSGLSPFGSFRKLSISVPNGAGIVTGPALPTSNWGVLGNTGTNSATNFIGTLDNVGLSFRTVNATRMFLATSGNLGIGNTVPSERLEVTGKALLTNGFSATNGALLYKSNTDHMYLGPQSGSSAQGGVINLFGSSNNVSGNPGGIDLITSLNNRIRILSNGNVGINTSNPQEILHVVGNIRMEDGNQGAGKVLTSDANGTATWQNPVPSGGTVSSVALSMPSIFSVSGSPVTTAGTLSASLNNQSENLVFAGPASGGAATPSFRSLVAADIPPLTSAQTNAWGLSGNAGTNASVNFIGTTDVSDLVFRTNSFEKMRIKADGFIGIGTNNPSSLLHLKANTPAIIIEDMALGATTSRIEFKDGTSTTVWDIRAGGGAPSGGFQIDSYNPGFATRFHISTNGNIGMGTTIPSEKLEVSGKVLLNNGFSANNAALLYRSSVDYLFVGPQSGSSGQGGAINLYGTTNNAGSNPGGIDMFTQGGNRLRILSGGNVGIGTATPNGLFELGLDQGRKPGTSTWIIVSDARLKNTVGQYTKGLNEILQLNPITYQYRNSDARIFNEEVLNQEFAGFNAQDVQQIFPEAVGMDEDGFLNLNMHAILVAYVNAFKEQQNQINDLQKENQDLKNTVHQLYEEWQTFKLIQAGVSGTTSIPASK
jgi:hypothetical protein